MTPQQPVDPAAATSSSELRAHIERVLNAHYELDHEIGRGGMGVVYLARDRRLKRQVAIKVLPPELAFQSAIKTRFLREAETAAQLSHPHIVPIYSVDELEGLVFFVMAYVSGDNLAKRLHDSGVLQVDDVRRITREVGDALSYAHERGVVHRDIKPDNILLDQGTGRTMVTDFGIARAASESDTGRLTATGMAIGTPAYMSPEQAAGDRHIDGRSDLYSLGVVAYQMLVGEPPFVANSTPAMLVKHISEQPTPISQRRSDVPVDLARAVMMCLEKEPGRRFPSADALVTALETGAVPEPVPAYESVQLPARATPAAPPAYPYEQGMISAEELRRQNAPEVRKFRKKLAPYLFVNSVFVIAAIFFDADFIMVPVIWSVVIAHNYAKLWGEGYDWRDVFRQPRDKELIDVADEFVDEAKVLFDRDKRKQLREKKRQAQIGRRSSGAVLRDTLDQSAQPYTPSGPEGNRVRQATLDRDEIRRLVESLPSSDRAAVAEVPRSADKLHDRIQSLARSLGEIDSRGEAPDTTELEDEISRLESQANPLERGSEERVRRLAYLKRQRRAASDVRDRREAVAAKLETCAIALHQLKLDLLRLRAGAQTHQRVTTLALQAMELADNVDSALQVSDELARTDRLGVGMSRQSVRPG